MQLRNKLFHGISTQSGWTYSREFSHFWGNQRSAGSCANHLEAPIPLFPSLSMKFTEIRHLIFPHSF